MAEDAIEPTADFHYTKEEIGFLSKVKSTSLKSLLCPPPLWRVVTFPDAFLPTRVL